MIKFRVAGKAYTITEPTIEKYYQIQDLLLVSDLIDTRVKIISILSGASEENLRAWSNEELEKVWTEATYGPLANSAGSFEKTIKLGDQEFGFIDITKLTVGEMADMDTIRNHPQMDKQLHKMMAILWRPVIEKEPKLKIADHETEGFEERAQLFLEQMPIGDVLKSISFFFHIAKTSLESTMDSLVETLMEKPKMTNRKTAVARIFKSQDNGLSSSTSLPEINSSMSTEPQNSVSSQPLTFWHIVRTKLNAKNKSTKGYSNNTKDKNTDN